MKTILRELLALFVGAAIGVTTTIYQPELTNWVRGITGYVKVAEYRVSVIGDHVSSLSHGLHYMKINSNKIDDGSYTLHLEYRVEGQASNSHDSEPLQNDKVYRYRWKGNGYILRVESLPKSLDGADIAIYQSSIEIGG